MADNKKKPVRIITPAFIARLAYISAPSERYGNYSARGSFDPKNAEHRKFLGQLKKLHQEAIAEARPQFKPTKKQPELEVVPCYNEDEDAPTLYCTFSEKAKISFKDKKTKEEKTIELKPEIFDANGAPCNVEIWQGSKIKCAIDVVPFFNGTAAGLSLRLKGVQVLELVTRGKRDMGFGKEEGSFDSNNFMPPSVGADDDADDEFDDFNSEDTGAEETLDETPAGEATGSDDDFDF